METDDKIRLQRLLEELKHTKYSLSIALGYTNGSVLNNVANGRNGISSKLANNIVDKFPQIDYKWLLKGEGSMLVEPKEATGDNYLLKRVEALERISEGQDARIKLQSLEIIAQNTRIEKLEALFDTKKNLMPQSF